MFVYESIPGTTVNQFAMNGSGVEFSVEGTEDTQITLGLEPEKDFDVCINKKFYALLFWLLLFFFAAVFCFVILITISSPINSTLALPPFPNSPANSLSANKSSMLGQNVF